MLNDFDYESIYYKIISGEYGESEKDAISEAILGAYKKLDF